MLCAAGGASVAAQVIAATQGVPLAALESTDPRAVTRTVGDDLAATFVVVVGTSIETEAHRRTFEQAFRDAGIDPAGRFAVVADGAVAEESRAAGFRVFDATAGVRGGFTALTPAALVPAGLAGADLDEVLDEAESELLDLAIDAPTNNGLVLAAAIAGSNPRRDKLVVVADGTHLVGFGDWIEQLVAGATGKDGSGLLPVVVEVGAPELVAPADDVQVVRLVDEATDDRHDPLLAAGELLLSGSLGELLAVWQVAVAIAGALIGVDPFDEPALDALAAGARTLLADPPQASPPRFVEGRTAVWSIGPELEGAATLAEAVEALVAAVPASGYLAVTAYADAAAHPGLRELRDLLAARSGRPATFGWAPQVLHGAAQIRLDGAPVGATLIVTARVDEDLPLAGSQGGYADLTLALSRAEAAALAARGRPVLHVEVDGEDGVAALLRAAR